MFEGFIYVVHIQVRPLETCFYYFVAGLFSSSCAASRQNNKYLQLFSPAHPGGDQHFSIIPLLSSCCCTPGLVGGAHFSDASAPVISYSHRICRCSEVVWSGMKPEQHGCQKDYSLTPKATNSLLYNHSHGNRRQKESPALCS